MDVCYNALLQLLLRNVSGSIADYKCQSDNLKLREHFVSIERLINSRVSNLDPEQMLLVYNHIVLYLRHTALPKASVIIQKGCGNPENNPPSSSMDISDTEFQYLRNTLDIYLKLHNACNRNQATTGLVRPVTKNNNLEYSNLDCRAKLIYCGKGKFNRLFLYDKTGLVNNTPTVVPLSQEENRFMVLYLYVLRNNKGSYVFPSYIDDSEQWETKRSSSALGKFIRDNLGLTLQQFPKQHNLRNLFLNIVGIKNNYTQSAFVNAGILLRNDVNQIQSDYLKWTRMYHTNYWNFLPPLAERIEAPGSLLKDSQMDVLYNLALSYADSTFSHLPAPTIHITTLSYWATSLLSPPLSADTRVPSDEVIEHLIGGNPDASLYVDSDKYTQKQPAPIAQNVPVFQQSQESSESWWHKNVSGDGRCSLHAAAAVLSYVDTDVFLGDYYRYLDEREGMLKNFLTLTNILGNKEYQQYAAERGKNAITSDIQKEWRDNVNTELNNIPINRQSAMTLALSGEWVTSEAATAGIFFKDFIVHQFRKRDRGVVFVQTLVDVALPSVSGYYSTPEIRDILDSRNLLVSLNSYFKNRRLVIFCLQNDHWHSILPVSLLEPASEGFIHRSISHSFYRGYVGVDASPNCVAVSILNAKSLEVHVWLKGEVTSALPPDTDSFTLKVRSITDRAKLFSELCKFFSQHIKDKQYNCAIEGPLLPGKNVDSRQTKFVVDLREYIEQNSVVPLFDAIPWRLRQHWMSLVPKLSKWNYEKQSYLLYGSSLKDFGKKVAKIQNYLTYAYLSENELKFLPKLHSRDNDFIGGGIKAKAKGDDYTAEVKTRIRAAYGLVGEHPFSDIVDSISVAYYMSEMDKVGSTNRWRPNCDQ